jgi:hypothetical protein
MGYLSLLGDCGACGRLFMSNPGLVSSLRLPDGRQVIFCRACVEAANPERERRGLPPVAYEPHQET